MYQHTYLCNVVAGDHRVVLQDSLAHGQRLVKLRRLDVKQLRDNADKLLVVDVGILIAVVTRPLKYFDS